MAGEVGSFPGEADGGGRVSSPPLAEVEAVAADWMLEFACCCLCWHFGEGGAAEFRRWRDVAHGEGRGPAASEGAGTCGSRTALKAACPRKA